MSTTPPEDWAEIVRDVARGDRVAFLKLSRLITGFLTQSRAFDFQDDWDDVVQDVVMATIEAIEKDRIRDPKAVFGYVRSATRFKFVDRIRSKQRRPTESDSTAEKIDAAYAGVGRSGEFRDGEVWDALSRLPEKQRVAIRCVYAEGLTYEEAASQSGIPLGSLKRYLRQGLASLRDVLAPGDLPPSGSAEA